MSVTSLFGTPPPIFRGATVRFVTTFYDADGAVTQPSGAVVNVAYFAEDALQTIAIDMTPPSGGNTAWTAEWDSRGADPGAVAWSIHTVAAGIPYSVEDGQFVLAANNANLPTF